jgi:hypothetical protein
VVQVEDILEYESATRLQVSMKSLDDLHEVMEILAGFALRRANYQMSRSVYPNRRFHNHHNFIIFMAT